LKLLVFSHKVCWKSTSSPTGWATDGGFSMHMDALAPYFDSIEIVAPEGKPKVNGEVYFASKNLKFSPLVEWVNPAKANLVKIVLPFWFIRYLPFMLKRMNSADLIHVPLPSHIGLLAVFLAVIFRKKQYVRHCGDWNNPKTITEKVTKYLLETFQTKHLTVLATGGGEIPPSTNSKIRWIFSSSLWRKELDQSYEYKKIDTSNSIKLIHVARQESEKGAMLVIEALKILSDCGQKAKLSIVGVGNALNALKDKALKLDLADKVTFHGKMNHDGVMETLKKSDIFCYPTSASEGFPKVVLEAMSVGIPVISTPVSVLKKMVPESGAGMLIAPDPQELADKIKYLMTNPAVYEQMSASGIHFSKQFSLEDWARKIMTHIETELDIHIIK
jgi:glycosyltransferase involved in cell wall biosynthesis